VVNAEYIRRSFLEFNVHCEIDARLGEVDARLIESTRSRLSESRELLSRVGRQLSALPGRRKPHGAILREAMERAFDKWTDQKASPIRRSTLIH
jgi:hypothetical protein